MTAKWGQPDEGRQTQDSVRNSMGYQAGEESADEHWRPAGGGDIHVDDRSAPGRDGGVEVGAKIERSGVDN